MQGKMDSAGRPQIAFARGVQREPVVPLHEYTMPAVVVVIGIQIDDFWDSAGSGIAAAVLGIS